MTNEVIIAGYLSEDLWQGLTHRSQDHVIGTEGICLNIPALYSNHAFKIMEYEEDGTTEPYAGRGKPDAEG